MARHVEGLCTLEVPFDEEAMFGGVWVIIGALGVVRASVSAAAVSAGFI